MFRTGHHDCLGIIGGLGAIAGADLYFKLAKCAAAGGFGEKVDIIFEQHSFEEPGVAGLENANPNARKLYIFDLIKQFERREVDKILIPCFISHTFFDELTAEIELPIVSIMDALRSYLERRHPEQKRLGILTSAYVKKKRLFERWFADDRYALLYPADEVQNRCLMPAIYGESGIKAGCLQGQSVDLLYEACQDLLAQGAELVVPGATEVSIVVDALRERGVPIIDANQIYAQHALAYKGAAAAKPFKVGIIGGVGPAATVDFMNKIIRNTPASKDQDHIKLIVEHNPKIPDRTENLIGAGNDPTIALYSSCKKLEVGGADMIAIPCNTAHAFVERIQPYLSIPIVNMLFETVDFIRKFLGDRQGVGLLATSGTIASGVYHDMFADTHFQLIVPDDAHQRRVMNAIYGEKGVKAGSLDGDCRSDLLLALSHLVGRGAEIIILGCTELPLLIQQNMDFTVAGKSVAVLDPTEILARKCVALARQTSLVACGRESAV